MGETAPVEKLATRSTVQKEAALGLMRAGGEAAGLVPCPEERGLDALVTAAAREGGVSMGFGLSFHRGVPSPRDRCFRMEVMGRCLRRRCK